MKLEETLWLVNGNPNISITRVAWDEMTLTVSTDENLPAKFYKETGELYELTKEDRDAEDWLVSHFTYNPRIDFDVPIFMPNPA